MTNEELNKLIIEKNNLTEIIRHTEKQKENLKNVVNMGNLTMEEAKRLEKRWNAYIWYALKMIEIIDKQIEEMIVSGKD